MKNILLLEDDTGLRFTFAMALKDAGYNVTTAADCDSAMDLLREGDVEVLVLDLKIGGLMSTGVADYASVTFPEIPVLYITGSGLFPSGELFQMSKNARWVLRKPVNLVDLLSLVDHVTSDRGIRANA